MTVDEQKVIKVEDTAGKAGQESKTQMTESSQSEDNEEEEDDAAIPSLEGLKKSANIQAKKVEERLAELQAIQSKGKFRSRRGGPKDNYFCKKEVPWSQNHILSGTSQSRTT